MSSVLFSVLLNLTITTFDDNGFETLVVLRDRYGSPNRQTMNSTLVRIVSQTVGETTLIEQLTKWEFDMPEYEEVTAEHPLANQQLSDRPAGEHDCSDPLQDIILACASAVPR